MGVFQNLAGTLASFFQIGGPSGPGLNANGATLEVRNAANSTFAVARGATPVAANDLVTKAYADAIALGDQNSVIYRQGAVAPVAPVYGTFDDAYIAAKAYGGPALLLVDNSLGQPVTTAGAYDFTNITIAGNPAQSATLNCVNGTTFTNVTRIVSLTMLSLSASPIMTIPATSTNALLLEEFATLNVDASATAPFILLTSGGSFSMSMFMLATIRSFAGGVAVVSVPAGASLFLTLDYCQVFNDTLTGAGNIFVTLASASSVYGLTQTGASALSVFNTALAPQVNYTPAVAARWNPVPAIVSAALDQLAATREFQFAAFASVVTAAPQAVPPGSGALTSTADTVLGSISPIGGLISSLQVQFTGAVGNAGGQTVIVKIQKNGADVAGLTTTAIATTAGVKTQAVQLVAPLAYVKGDVFTAILTPSALLTTALADVMVACS